MGTIFMNSENSTTSESHVLILQLTDKLDLKRGEKIFFCQTFVFISYAHIITTKSKYSF